MYKRQRQHIQGHKELTEHVDILEIKAGNCVYIPMLSGASTNLEMLVQEGDKVLVGTKLAVCNAVSYTHLYGLSMVIVMQTSI